MLFLEYKDFDDLYFNFSRLPLLEEDKYGYYFFNCGASTYLSPVIISTPSFNCHLDMSDFNYTRMKWTVLVNKYLDQEQYELLKKKLAESTTRTLTFNFKIHTTGKDACLVALVFERDIIGKPWTTVNVYYRVTEVFKKFAIDLILLNRILNDVPNCEIKEIIFHIPLAFFSIFILSELIGNNFELEEFNKDNFATNKIHHMWNKYYGEGHEPSNYHSIARKQKMREEGIKLDKIPIESLILFQNKNKKEKGEEK